ncbi:MAG TPA: CTP synthase [Candidatus Paceibacterota bacterium]|nr:CTP synthase [Candidatus Paceibacterota bacterium]
MKRSKRRKEPNLIFVTGGIVSGIGKGISVASLAALLKMRGFEVVPIKIDPYLNRDAGTMNPYQHGEVYVTEDGAETDLDLGHYERFINVDLDGRSNFTTGSVYEYVIGLERHGDYLGKTIQIIPHVTDEIKRRIMSVFNSNGADVAVVEIGGTVGDIEAEPFLEAARQMFREYGPTRVIFIHVVKVDYIYPSDEEKTKPIQQSVALLRERGIQPDFLIVRSKRPITKANVEKISLFTNVLPEHIIPAVDVRTIYEVPVNFRRSGFDELILKKFGKRTGRTNFASWRRAVSRMSKARRTITIALIGKYVEQDDAYLSVEESVAHAAAAAGVRVELKRIDSESPDLVKKLKGVKGIIVPGGFGKRGIEGKIKAIKFARESNVPFLGLCLGLQTAVIEFARNVCRLKSANSTEFSKRTPHPVIDIMPDQKKVKMKGGTMRLGTYRATLDKDSLVRRLYGVDVISERHRHRYEVNPKYHDVLKKHGLVLSGFNLPDKRLVEFIELPKHKFFIATQAHPEFKSRFLNPHPLFLGFIRAAIK